METHDCLRCINHLSFCSSRVNRKSMSANKHLGSIEGLVAELAKRTAVNGVAISGAKGVKIQKSSTVTNFLIRDKRKCNAWMLELWMFLVASKQANKHGNTSLVIKQ